MGCCTNRSPHHSSLDSPRASRTPSDVRSSLIISGIWFGVEYCGFGIWTLDASYPGEAAFTTLSVSSSTTHRGSSLTVQAILRIQPDREPCRYRMVSFALHWRSFHSFYPIIFPIFASRSVLPRSSKSIAFQGNIRANHNFEPVRTTSPMYLDPHLKGMRNEAFSFLPYTQGVVFA